MYAKVCLSAVLSLKSMGMIIKSRGKLSEIFSVISNFRD